MSVARKLVLVGLVLAAYPCGAAEPGARPEETSPATATWISAAATIVPALAGSLLITAAVRGDVNGTEGTVTGLTLMGLGLSFGPSAGHFHAGEARRGIVRSVVRAALLGGAAGLTWYALHTDLESAGSAQPRAHDDVSCKQACSVFAAAVLAAAAVGMAIYDVADARESARRMNRLRRGPTAAVAPVFTRNDGKAAAGMAVAGRF